MATASNAPVSRQLVAERHYNRTVRSLLAICGSMIALFGVVMAIGGAFATLESGDFFIFAGFGLIISGALLAMRHAAGAWTYLAVFAATLVWSLQDSGLGGSPMGYRIAGPVIMLVMIALLMPALRRWSRRRTVAVLALLIIATVMAGDLSSDGLLTSPTMAASQFHDAQTEGVMQ